MVVAVTCLTWTDENLLRHVVFDGVREDNSARDVVRPIPGPEKVAPTGIRPKRAVAETRDIPGLRKMIAAYRPRMSSSSFPRPVVPSGDDLVAY